MKLFGFKIDKKGWFEISNSEWFGSNIALIIIDMQNYDTSRQWGIIGTEGSGTTKINSDYYYRRLEKTVIPNLKKIIDYFREKKLKIIHLRISSQYRDLTDMPDLWKLRMYQHQRDSGKSYNPYFKSSEMQIIKELMPSPGEMEIIKTTGNAFTSTNLDFILRNCNIKSLVIGGVWLNSCVEDTIRVGADLGYLITLLEDGTAAPDEEFHNASIRVLGSMYCNVKKTEEILRIQIPAIL